ncbi:MAG: hypothetical protein EHM30_06045 [Desulfobacteraceae bacterium]|nr:MAG: hypothetical protein EHM30_06045 [Desulfobacteraceae bacterium]
MAGQKKSYSRTETFIGAAVILLLVITGMLIFLKQFRYDPSIFPSGMTLAVPEGGPLQGEKTDKTISFKNMAPMTPPEIFNSENLSEKINGKAELYLTAGFKSLTCQRFSSPGNTGLWLEVFVYDMGSIENAFAVYSVQKREGSTPLQLTGFIYKTENAVFFVHGNYYVEITSSEVSDSLMDSMLSFSGDFIKTRNVRGKTIPELALFPPNNLDSNSIILFPSNAFGFDKLNMVFAADYKTEKGKIKAFLSRRKNENEAKEIAKSYSDFLISLGGKHIKSGQNQDNIEIIEIMDTYEFIFSNGSFLAGIHSAEDLNEAKKAASALYKKLGDKTVGR